METQLIQRKERRIAQIPADQLNQLIIDAIQDKKGIDLIKLDLRSLEEAPADFFIICNGNSETQVKAIADNIQYELKQKVNELPSHIEGIQNATWVLIDYFDVVVHVFHQKARKFYQLEKLWNDAVITEYQNL